MTDEIEPISPEQAKAILENAIREQLGDDWEDEDTGWVRVTGHDYMARLTRGRTNLDFYVDLLGNVSIHKSELNPAQASGRLIALVVLLACVGVAIMMAHVIGWL
jgi:hypothetical protein